MTGQVYISERELTEMLREKGYTDIGIVYWVHGVPPDNPLDYKFKIMYVVREGE